MATWICGRSQIGGIFGWKLDYCLVFTICSSCIYYTCLANCWKVMQSFCDTLYYESQAKQDISRESDTLYIYHFTTKVLQPTAWKCILNGADQGKMTKIAFLIVSIGAYYEIYTTCSTLQKCKTNYVKMMRAKLNSIMRSLERSYPINRSRYKMLYRI